MNHTVKSIAFSTCLALVGGFAGTAGMTQSAAAAEVKLVKQVAPKYPRGAERRKIEGHVVVGYTILSDGTVSDVSVVEAVPEGVFDDAAMKALSKWKFEKPASDMPDRKTKISFKL